MIHVDSKSRYLGSLLLIALAAIGVGLLALHWQPAAAQEQDESGAENTQEGTNGTEGDQNGSEQGADEMGAETTFYEFEEADGSLTLTVDTSSRGTILKLQAAAGDDDAGDQAGEDQGADQSDETDDQNGEDQNTEGDDQAGEGDDQNGEDQTGEDQMAAGSDLPRVEDADDQPVWQYIGPSSLDEGLGCQSRSWSDLGQPTTAAASLSEDNEEDKPVKASLSVRLMADASTDTHYCFRVPYVAADGGENSYYISYQLTEAPEPGSDTEHFVFSPGSVQDEDQTRDIEASLKEGEASGWQYALVDSADICSEENAGTLTFEDGNRITVTSEDAGKIYCFRAVPADRTDGSYVYEAHTVPAIDDGAGGEEESSSTRLWVALAVVAGVGIAALVIYMLNKSRG